MTSSFTDYLDDIIRSADLCSGLSVPSARENLSGSRQVSSNFHLPLCDLDSFESRLHCRNISSPVRRKLSALYEESSEHFRHFSSKNNAVLLVLPRQQTPKGKAKLEATLVNLYLGHLRGFQEAILQEVDVAIARFHADAEASAQSEGESSSSSSSEDGLIVSRGLPPLATKMFEAVYARTDKITQAERDCLSEASGVPPRSVTIWVSLFSHSGGRTKGQKTRSRTKGFLFSCGRVNEQL